MSAPHYAIRLDTTDIGVRVVVSGEIDALAVPEFFTRLQEADRVRRGPLVVVMDDVTLIDSSGLGVIARLAAAQVDIEIRGARGIARRALDISGLAKSPYVRIEDGQ